MVSRHGTFKRWAVQLLLLVASISCAATLGQVVEDVDGNLMRFAVDNATVGLENVTNSSSLSNSTNSSQQGIVFEKGFAIAEQGQMFAL